MENFYIKTFGCKLNQYESELIREHLLQAGFQESDSLENVDFLIVGSCAVTLDSVKGLRKFIKSARRKSPYLKIIVMGCLVDVYPEELEKIDCFLTLDNKNKFNLAGILSGRTCSFSSRIREFKSHTRAFVKIQDGCDNRCSFCCVWMARGKSHSRDKSEIISEIENLLKAGYKEIVLTGLCLGDYGKDINFSLAGLLQEIDKLSYDFRIRLSSIEPQDVSEDLISSLRDLKKAVPHLHIPLQSGSDKILKLMRRKYDSIYFRNLIRKLREIDNFQFSTDVVIGFPQEEEEDFQKTVQLLKEFQPIRVHIFPFSPRAKTPAYSLPGKVSPELLQKRKKKLQKILDEIIRENLKRQIGKKFQVLFEKKINGYWLGYSENYILSALSDKRELRNKLLSVVTTGIMTSTHILLTELH